MNEPDVAWRGGAFQEHLTLTEQQYAVVRQEHRSALAVSQGDNGLDATLNRTLPDQGPDQGRWERTDSTVKSEESLCRKVASRTAPGEELDEQKIGAMVNDTNRFTRSYSTEHYSEAVRSDIAALESSERFSLVRGSDNWQQETNKGINSTWYDQETGRQFEIQFHTHESLQATEQTHAIYEYERVGTPFAQTPAEQVREKQICDRLQYEANQNVGTPAGHDDIDDRIRPSARRDPTVDDIDDTEFQQVRSHIERFSQAQHEHHADPPEPGRDPGPGTGDPQTVATRGPPGHTTDDYLERMTRQAEQGEKASDRGASGPGPASGADVSTEASARPSETWQSEPPPASGREHSHGI